jgi:hypothetical protein
MAMPRELGFRQWMRRCAEVDPRVATIMARVRLSNEHIGAGIPEKEQLLQHWCKLNSASKAPFMLMAASYVHRNTAETENVGQ